MLSKFSSFKALLKKFIIYKQFRSLLEDCLSIDINVSEASDKIAVIVTPWFGSYIPIVSLTIAAQLIQRKNKVVIIFDDVPFTEQKLLTLTELFFLKSIINVFKSSAVSLSKYDKFLTSDPMLLGEKINEIILNYSIWKFKGEQSSSSFENSQLYIHLNRKSVLIQKLLSQINICSIHLPGGVVTDSALWLEICKRYKINTFTFDTAANGLTISSTIGPACHQADIPKSLGLLKLEFEKNPSLASLCLSKARDQFELRRRSADKFSYQKTHHDHSDIFNVSSTTVLFALNSSWDSAALGLNAVFQSQTEWLIESIAYILSSSSYDVIVRQHPVERFKHSRTSDDYYNLLLNHFGHNARICFIDAFSNVNTYTLLDSIKFVCCHSSTFGLEAAAHGLPVLISSNCYYSELGFTFKGKTKARYFSLISDMINGNLVVSSPMKFDAWMCYYLTQCCNWADIPLNAFSIDSIGPTDFQALLFIKDTKYLLESIETNIPFSFLKHQLLHQQYSKP